jgi:hypothetical protein
MKKFAAGIVALLVFALVSSGGRALWDGNASSASAAESIAANTKSMSQAFTGEKGYKPTFKKGARAIAARAQRPDQLQRGGRATDGGFINFLKTGAAAPSKSVYAGEIAFGAATVA